jgi:hypothetical protein
MKIKKLVGGKQGVAEVCHGGKGAGGGFTG